MSEGKFVVRYNKIQQLTKYEKHIFLSIKIAYKYFNESRRDERAYFNNCY